MTIRKLKKRLKLGKQHLPNKFIKDAIKAFGNRACLSNCNGCVILVIREPIFDNAQKWYLENDERSI